MGKRYRDMSADEKRRHLAQTAAWAKRNPDRVKEIGRLSKRRTYISGWHRQKRYGVSTEMFEAMLQAQGRRCAICGVTEPGARDWHLDHDHGTGLPRGILCVRCNGGLGQFKDSPELMERGAQYLRQAKLRELF